MKIYKYYIVYQIVLQKDDKAKTYFAPIELGLFEKIKSAEPVAEIIKEEVMKDIKDKDIEIGIVIYNWKLLDEYEVEDETKKDS